MKLDEQKSKTRFVFDTHLDSRLRGNDIVDLYRHLSVATGRMGRSPAHAVSSTQIEVRCINSMGNKLPTLRFMIERVG